MSHPKEILDTQMDLSSTTSDGYSMLSELDYYYTESSDIVNNHQNPYQDVAYEVERRLGKRNNPSPRKAIDAFEYLKKSFPQVTDRKEFYKLYPVLIAKIEDNLPGEYIQKESFGYEKGYAVSKKELMDQSEVASENNDPELAEMYSLIANQDQKETIPAVATNKKNRPKYSNQKDTALGMTLGMAGDFLTHGAWSGVKFAFGAKEANLTDFSLKHTEKTMGGSISGVDVKEKEKIDKAKMVVNRKESEASISLSSFPIEKVSYLTDSFELRSGNVNLKDLTLSFKWTYTEGNMVKGTLGFGINHMDIKNLRMIFPGQTFGIANLGVEVLNIKTAKEFYFSKPISKLDNIDILFELLQNEIPSTLKYLVQSALQIKQHIAPASSQQDQKEQNDYFAELLSKDISNDISIQVDFNSIKAEDFVSVGKTIEHIQLLTVDKKSTINMKSDNSAFSAEDMVRMTQLKKELVVKRAELTAYYERPVRYQAIKADQIKILEDQIKGQQQELNLLLDKQSFTTSIDLKGVKVQDGNYIRNAYKNLLPEHHLNIPDQVYDVGDVLINSNVGSGGKGTTTISDKLDEISLPGPVHYFNPAQNIGLSFNQSLSMKNISAVAIYNYTAAQTDKDATSQKTLSSLSFKADTLKGEDMVLKYKGQSINLENREIEGIAFEMKGDNVDVGVKYIDLSRINIAGLLSNNRNLEINDLMIHKVLDKDGISFGASMVSADVTVMDKYNTKGVATGVQGASAKDSWQLSAESANLSGSSIDGVINTSLMTGQNIKVGYQENVGYSFGADQFNLAATLKGGSSVKGSVSIMEGSYSQSPDGTECLTLQTAELALPYLDINTGQYRITSPPVIAGMESKVYGIEASIEFKRGEHGIEYVILDKIKIDEVRAFGLQVSDASGRKVLDAPSNVESSFADILVEGFGVRMERNEMGAILSTQRMVTADKGIARISTFNLPEISYYMVRKKLQKPGLGQRIQATAEGLHGSVAIEQEKGKAESTATLIINSGDIDLPQMKFKGDTMEISVSSTGANTSVLKDVQAEFTAVLGSDNKPVSYRLKNLKASSLMAYGLTITKGGQKKPSLKMDEGVAVSLKELEFSDVRLDKNFKVQSLSGKIESVDVPEFKAFLIETIKGKEKSKDEEKEVASATLGLQTGKISFNMADQNHYTVVIENPKLPLFAALKMNTAETKGEVNKTEAGGFDFLSADKLEITIDNQKDTKEFKIYNPVLDPIKIDGTLPKMKDSIEHYYLTIGGKIDGMFLVNSEGNQITVESWDIKMKDALLSLMLKEKPKTKFEDFSKEDQEKRKDELTALKLYTPQNNFSFLDAATYGNVIITLFGYAVTVDVESVLDKDGKEEYGYVNLQDALEQISAIMGKNVKSTNIEIVEGFKANRGLQNLEADKVGNNYVLQASSLDLDQMVLVPDYEKNVKLNRNGEPVVRLSSLVEYQISKPMVAPQEKNEDIEDELARWKANNLLNLKIDVSALYLKPELLDSSKSLGYLEPLKFIKSYEMYDTKTTIDFKKMISGNTDVEVKTESLYIKPIVYKNTDQHYDLNTGAIALNQIVINYIDKNKVSFNVKDISLDSIKFIKKPK